MAKGKNGTTPAEDYIDQLQWRAQRRRWVPVRFEPKWKYKIVYRYPRTTIFERALGLALLIGIIFIVGSVLLSDLTPTGAKIFFGSVFGLILLIVVFAVRDVSKNKDNKAEDVDE